jgi:hypothetical protein
MRDAPSSPSLAQSLIASIAMSKRINVNPGQYKVAGREHQGDDIVQAEHKAAASKKAEELRNQARRAKQPAKKR